ncbi:perilipin 1, partial [Homo sapiens]
EEELETEENKFSEVAALPGPRGLLGGVAHTLQKTLQTTISALLAHSHISICIITAFTCIVTLLMLGNQNGDDI